MLPLKLTIGLFPLLLVVAAAPADIHEPPIITGNFYDPNYHDDGRNRLRGPTAASSSSTISIMNPYATSSQISSEQYNKAPQASPSQSQGGRDGGSIMAIVDHYYGPNGEEKVQYKTANEMDKDELDQILQSLSAAKLSNQPSPQHHPHMAPPSSSAKHHYSHSPPSKLSSPPQKYVGPPSNLYKSSSSPSQYTASSQGFSLPSLYKSSSEAYPRPAAPYSPNRPAYSTIYKDASPYSSAGRGHYSKPSEYYPHPPKEPFYASSYKEPVPHPKEPSYMRGPPYYMQDSHQHPPPPKSISDSIMHSEPYKNYPPPPPKPISNVIDHEEGHSFYSVPHGYAPPIQSSPGHHHGPPPPPGPPHMTTHVISSHEQMHGNDEPPKLYSPSLHLLKDEYPAFAKEPQKAGLHSMPLKYSTPDINYAPPPSHTVHPNAFTSGFGPSYSTEESNDPYSSRPGKYSKRPPLGGQSLSSLYEPLSFDDLYNSPKSKYVSPPASIYAASSSGSKPSFGPPPGYGHSYGSPVEYHMPPPKGPYSTSSSPYSQFGPPGPSPKYKGPYRTLNTGPSGFAPYGYGYGKPHHHLTNHVHGEDFEIHELRDSPHPHPYRYPRPPINVETISLAKDEYEETKFKPSASSLISSPSGPSGPAPSGSAPNKPEKPYHMDRTQITKLSHHHHASKKSEEPLRHQHSNKVSLDKTLYPQYSHIVPSVQIKPPQNLRGEGGGGSDEVVNIHIYEKGFFDKKKPRKEQRDEWKPVFKPYSFPGFGTSATSKEGGFGSASMENANVQSVNSLDLQRSKFFNRPPPPNRRKLEVEPERPYHRKLEEGDDEDTSQLKLSPFSYNPKRI